MNPRRVYRRCAGFALRTCNFNTAPSSPHSLIRARISSPPIPCPRCSGRSEISRSRHVPGSRSTIIRPIGAWSFSMMWYLATYAAAENQIIEKDHAPIGRMIVLREPGTCRLLDISLLPEHRGQGIGGELIRALIKECGELGAVLKLQVLNANPAQRLYTRLGFIKTGEDQIYMQMELRPHAAARD